MLSPGKYTLRQIELPGAVPGRLFAASMPGRYSRDFAADRQVIQESGVDTVVCLATLVDLMNGSPAYARALQNQTLPWHSIHLPVPDFGVPEDREAFLQMAQHIASLLRGGGWVMVHCAAGIGRTGMFSTLVLLALGRSLDEARSAVQQAGSGAEEESQRRLEAWAAAALSNDNPAGDQPSE